MYRKLFRIRRACISIAAVTACLVGICLIAGCQSAINGQVLPSPSYMTDDIQYFPAGPEFKLPKEAAALKAVRAAEARQ